jgi:hypothetical protein
MIKEELIKDGWKEEDCMTGTLYFKDGFFCRFVSESEVKVFSVCDDTHPLGITDSLDGITEFKKMSDAQDIGILQFRVSYLKGAFKDKYGIEYDEYERLQNK